jgi:hypothetical protein
VAFLLLLYFFAVPSYLPIHFTTAEFSASTGGSSSMALSPPRIRQLMPKTQSFFIFTSHGLFLLLLQCLVPPSYSSVFTLLPHEHSSRLVLTFPSVSYWLLLSSWRVFLMPVLHFPNFVVSFCMCHCFPSLKTCLTGWF